MRALRRLSETQGFVAVAAGCMLIAGVLVGGLGWVIFFRGG